MGVFARSLVLSVISVLLAVVGLDGLVGFCWPLPAIADLCRPLLANVGHCRPLLAIAGLCRPLLAFVGQRWPLSALLAFDVHIGLVEIIVWAHIVKHAKDSVLCLLWLLSRSGL